MGARKREGGEKLMLRIIKVKITKENRIHISYEEKNSRCGWDEYSFTCADQARPEFYEKMNGLRIHVVDMCELPENYIDRIKVRGVSVSYGGEKEVMGATISAQMVLNHSNCDLNLNTPHKASDSYSDAPADEMQLLDPDCVTALREVYEECKAYISGDRAQGKLFAVG
jgi:hypothetical protein